MKRWKKIQFFFFTKCRQNKEYYRKVMLSRLFYLNCQTQDFIHGQKMKAKRQQKA